jgi:hypothetical protein
MKAEYKDRRQIIRPSKDALPDTRNNISLLVTDENLLAVARVITDGIERGRVFQQTHTQEVTTPTTNGHTKVAKPDYNPSDRYDMDVRVHGTTRKYQRRIRRSNAPYYSATEQKADTFHGSRDHTQVTHGIEKPQPETNAENALIKSDLRYRLNAIQDRQEYAEQTPWKIINHPTDRPLQEAIDQRPKHHNGFAERGRLKRRVRMIEEKIVGELSPRNRASTTEVSVTKTAQTLEVEYAGEVEEKKKKPRLAKHDAQERRKTLAAGKRHISKEKTIDEQEAIPYEQGVIFDMPHHGVNGKHNTTDTHSRTNGENHAVQYPNGYYKDDPQGVRKIARTIANTELVYGKASPLPPRVLFSSR